MHFSDFVEYGQRLLLFGIGFQLKKKGNRYFLARKLLISSNRKPYCSEWEMSNFGDPKPERTIGEPWPEFNDGLTYRDLLSPADAGPNNLFSLSNYFQVFAFLLNLWSWSHRFVFDRILLEQAQELGSISRVCLLLILSGLFTCHSNQVWSSFTLKFWVLSIILWTYLAVGCREYFINRLVFYCTMWERLWTLCFKLTVIRFSLCLQIRIDGELVTDPDTILR